MSEAPAPAPPSLAEALGWRGFALDDAAGREAGVVAGVYADAGGGAPVWLVVSLAAAKRRLPLRRRGGKTVAAPLRECAALPGRVWIAERVEALRDAPTIDPARPLLREHEAAICAHYGIGPGVGRHAELAAAAAGSVTAEPAF